MSILRILVATDRCQGQQGDDFHAATTGELVDLATTCHPNPDSPCGCARAFTGLTSRLATTTAEIIEREMTRDEYSAAFRESLRRAGLRETPHVTDAANAAAEEMAWLAQQWPLGSVIHRRGNTFTCRHEGPHK